MAFMLPGQTAFLECPAVGNPVPNVSWSKRNGELPASRSAMIFGGLRIENVTSSDDGVYVCSHKNSLGVITKQITLIYSEAPTVKQGPQNRNIREDEELDLECIVTGTPEPVVSWFLNGDSVLNDSLIEAVGNRIYFRPVEKRHAGILQCFASNVVGTVYSSAILEVVPKQISSTDLEEYGFVIIIIIV